MKKALYAAMLIAMGSYMAPASAVIISSTTSLGDLTGSSASIGNSFGSAAFGSLFNDVYTFDLTSLSQSVGTTVTFQIALGSNSIGLSNMAISLTDSALNVFDSDSQIVSGNTLSVNAVLGSGTGYRFVVTGDVTGNLGGSYGGVV